MRYTHTLTEAGQAYARRRDAVQVMMLTRWLARSVTLPALRIAMRLRLAARG